MFNQQISRAEMLIQRGMFREAEQILRQALSGDPQDGMAHAVLALALTGQKFTREAMKEIQQAIQLIPDHPHVHYIHSVILYNRKRWDEAIRAIEEAIRLDPHNADYFGMLSGMYFGKRDWQKTLSAAEQGRAIDPEHVQCSNMMAAALIKLGRKEEVDKVLGEALARDPDNADTHANQGWALLHAGQVEVAMIHFREALRIDPTNGSARSGILEALRARNPVYRVMLRYFLWMSRMSRQAQWGIILGGYFLVRIVNMVGAGQPSLAPFAFVLWGIYMLFAIMTWTARPLTDMLLRLDQNGRLLLSKSQIEATNLGLALVGLAALLLVVGLVSGNGTYFGGALGALALILPVFGTFQAEAGRRRQVLVLYTVVLTLLGAYAFGQALAGKDSAEGLTSIFMLAWVGFSWVANIVYSVRS